MPRKKAEASQVPWNILELALQALILMLETYKLEIEGQSPEVRAEIARLKLEDWKAWRAFVAQFKLPAS